MSQPTGHPYYPTQTLSDGEGRMVERDLATLPFFRASVARMAGNVARKVRQVAAAQRDLEFEQRALALFEEWDAAQRALGRPPRELTFGNFVREMGYWKPGSPLEAA